jgi:uncharacterized protein YmfQ (DUF2313 family)
MSETLEPQAACGFTGEDMTQVLADLLPQGPVWPRDPDTDLMKTMAGLAEEFARLLARDCDLLTESYPGTATETITDWERVCGLPDECTGPLETLQERRQAVLAKLALRGGQSRQYYIDGAERLGFQIAKITEFRPLIADEGRAGDACYFQSEGRVHDADNTNIVGPLVSTDRDKDWWFVWEITTTEETKTVYMRADASEAGDRLAVYGNSMLTCWVEETKPAHTMVLYSFANQPPGIWPPLP